MTIEPRYIFTNLAYSSAHLAGSTHQKMRLRKMSTTKGSAQGRFSYRTYVPLDLLPLTDQAHPESHPHVTVAEGQKIAQYREFVWDIRN